MRHSAFTILVSLTLIVSSTLYSQGVDDAIFNAQNLYEGTARSMAMGNATGAVGGDMTAVCINPAGLGLYRSGEFTFSTGLQHNLINSTDFGNNVAAGKTNISIPNTAYVASIEWSNYRPLRYMQFGVGLTRTNDYGYHSIAQGLNPRSSMVDAYLQTIEGIDELYDPTLNNPGDYLYDNYPYDLHPAWETYLIDRFHDSIGYYYSSPIPQGNLHQTNEVTSKGRSEEWTFAASANYYDKLFLGASLGLAHVKRVLSRTYTETPGNPASYQNTFSEWSFMEDLEIAGWGVNLKCGLVVYPTRWLRLGAAWHSRTHYSFDENWSTTTETKLLNNHQEDYHTYVSPTLYNEYNFRTPHTFIGSLAFLFGQKGMFTTDVEYLNYGHSRFHSSTYSFADTNSDLKETLGSSLNIRVGTEWRLRQYFLRGGLAYYGSPYGFGDSDGSVKKLALGIGYATHEDTYWDFAYELSETTNSYTPYRYYVDGENIAGDIIQRRFRNKFIITLKVKM